MSERPKRLLVVCPSWLGDVVMATPALRLLRDRLKGAFIGGLVRPGLDELLAGTSFFDELHVDRAQGVMGPKVVASKIRPRRYDAALLLTNSFSTALITRLAFIPRRVGYDRDGRGLLLTQRIKPLKRADGRYACVPAVEYYLAAARALIWPEGGEAGMAATGPVRLELGVSQEQEEAAGAVLRRLGVEADAPIAVLNPGANNPEKRWPAERFRMVAEHLISRQGMAVLVNGSPAEADLAQQVVDKLEGKGAYSLPRAGITIGALKGICRRARVMVTNDTGPRHIAAAFGVPTVTLYGPTDPRWTTLPPPLSVHCYPPGKVSWVDLVADPSLPESELADDHPERCRIEKIEVPAVLEAVDRVMMRTITPSASEPAAG